MNNNVYNNSLRKEIVEKADIVDIISQYVSLEKKGANYIGLCPFHDDKNPSMSVSPTKKVFKCFSCNTGGDVITFVSKIKNIPVREAMRIVGESCGVSVSVSKKELERQKNSKYYNLMNEANSFYQFYLKNSKEGEKALNYLTNRGLDINVINKFQIGLSSDNDSLFKVLLSKEYLEVDMLELGLVHSYSNTYHDYFKNRIIFPIKDLDGNVCGFSGRKYLENDNESKYKNTSENLIFKKGQILYNYYEAINSIKQNNCVFLFEGFMDVIAACRANVLNSVASMGTALTNFQIEAIKRLTNNVIICYDSDEAGINATLRAIDMFNNYDMNIKVVHIPDGKDPDEFIKNNGEIGLHKCLINNQTSALSYIYDINSKAVLFDDISSKENFKNTIFKNLIKFKSNSLIETFLNRLSNDLKISLESIKMDYSDFSKEFKVEIKSSDEDFVLDIPTKQNIEIKNKQEFKKYIKAERRLLRAAYENKDACFNIQASLNSIFVKRVNRNLLFLMYEYYLKHELMNYNDFMNLIDTEEMKNELIDILNNENIPSKDIVLDYINLLKEYSSAKIVVDIIENDIDRSIENLNILAENKKRTVKLTKKRG